MRLARTLGCFLLLEGRGLARGLFSFLPLLSLSAAVRHSRRLRVAASRVVLIPAPSSSFLHRQRLSFSSSTPLFPSSPLPRRRPLRVLFLSLPHVASCPPSAVGRRRRRLLPPPFIAFLSPPFFYRLSSSSRARPRIRARSARPFSRCLARPRTRVPGGRACTRPCSAALPSLPRVLLHARPRTQPFARPCSAAHAPAASACVLLHFHAARPLPPPLRVLLHACPRGAAPAPAAVRALAREPLHASLRMPLTARPLPSRAASRACLFPH